MKCRSWNKKARRLICGLLFAGAVCFGCSVHTYASQSSQDAGQPREYEAVTVEAEGILQNGGLLQEPSGNSYGRAGAGISAYGASTADLNAAEQKLEAGLDHFQTQISIEECGIAVEEFSEFYQNFINNHPKYFYLNGSCRYGVSGGYVTKVKFRGYGTNKSTGGAV